MGADLSYTIGIDPGSTGKVLADIRSQLLGLGAVAFGGGLLARGFEFNRTMYDGEKAIQSIVQQFQGLNAEAAKPVAANAMRQLVDLEPKVAGSLKDIVNGFVSTAAASAGVGLSVEQNIDLVGRFANALGKMSMPIEQVGQELRSILTGNIGADSQLAKTLGITNEMVESARKAGTLYELLKKEIGELGEAGDNAATAFSSLSSSIDKVAGALAEGLFKSSIDNTASLTAELDKNRDAFLNLGEGLGVTIKEGIKFVAFINEAATQTARLVAITGIMIGQSASYEEAAKAIDEAAAARRRETEAAEAEAKSIKESNAAKAAMATGKDKNPLMAPAKGKDETGTELDEAVKKYQEITDLQRKLGDLQKQTAEDEMSTADRVLSARKDLAAAEADVQRLRESGTKDESKILEAEIKQAEIQRQLLQLQKQQTKEAQDAARAAMDKADAAKREVAQHQQARNEMLGELAILKDQAAGHDKAAAAKEKELKIERDKQKAMSNGSSEEDALRYAREKAALEERIERRKEAARRREADPASRDEKGTHIGGVGARRMMGGALNDFTALQKSTSDWQALQKGKFGDGALAPGGGIGQTADRMSRMMGRSNIIPLSSRMAAAMTQPREKKTDASNTQTDPTLAKLDAIVSELKRFKAA